MKWVIFFLFSCAGLWGYNFTDPHTGMCVEIPSQFRLNEEESKMDRENDIWWYEFTDVDQSILTIEIEEYDHNKSLCEYFHHTLTDDDDEEENHERMIFEGLEFKNFYLNGITFTKCKVSLLAISDEITEPLYICDYLFVRDHYGFSVGLMKKDDGVKHHDQLEDFMQTILQSIHFP